MGEYSRECVGGGGLPHTAALELQTARGSGEQPERKSEEAEKHFHTSYKHQRA